MPKSLKEFKERFLEELITVHWKQWAALGVSSNIEPEQHRLIDLEALTASTLAIGLLDRRLFSTSVEWLIKNAEWASSARFKRIIKDHLKPLPNLNKPLIHSSVYDLFIDLLKKFDKQAIRFEMKRYESAKPKQEEASKLHEYKQFFDSFRPRGVVTGPKRYQTPLLQLQLRSLFGFDTRADIFLHLLFNESGNSNSIANEVYCDQKSVYRILETWAETEVVVKISGGKASFYSLRKKREWFQLLGLKEKDVPTYLNWAKTFKLLDEIAKALSDSKYSNDKYLLSSFFRDILNEAQSVAKPMRIQFPEPFSYPGAEYFPPFAETMFKLVDSLRVDKEKERWTKR